MHSRAGDRCFPEEFRARVVIPPSCGCVVSVPSVPSACVPRSILVGCTAWYARGCRWIPMHHGETRAKLQPNLRRCSGQSRYEWTHKRGGGLIDRSLANHYSARCSSIPKTPPCRNRERQPVIRVGRSMTIRGTESIRTRVDRPERYHHPIPHPPRRLPHVQLPLPLQAPRPTLPRDPMQSPIQQLAWAPHVPPELQEPPRRQGQDLPGPCTLDQHRLVGHPWEPPPILPPKDGAFPTCAGLHGAYHPSVRFWY